MQCVYTSSQQGSGCKGRNGLRDLPAGGEGPGSLVSIPLLIASPALKLWVPSHPHLWLRRSPAHHARWVHQERV